jgi:hypothetical protein
VVDENEMDMIRPIILQPYKYAIGLHICTYYDLICKNKNGFYRCAAGCRYSHFWSQIFLYPQLAHLEGDSCDLGTSFLRPAAWMAVI